MPERAKRETIAVKHAPRGARSHVTVLTPFIGVFGAPEEAKTGAFRLGFGLPKLP